MDEKLVRDTVIELFRTGVSQDAYTLLFQLCKLEDHQDIVDKLQVSNGMMTLSDEDADSF